MSRPLSEPIAIVPGVTTSSAYATGKVIGSTSKVTLPLTSTANGGAGSLLDITLNDLDSQNVAIDVFFSNTDPVQTNGATFAPAPSIIDNCLGVLAD